MQIFKLISIRILSLSAFLSWECVSANVFRRQMILFSTKSKQVYPKVVEIYVTKDYSFFIAYFIRPTVQKFREMIEPLSSVPRPRLA